MVGEEGGAETRASMREVCDKYATSIMYEGVGVVGVEGAQ